MYVLSKAILTAAGLVAGVSALTMPEVQYGQQSRTAREVANVVKRAPAAVTSVADGVTYDGCTYTVAGTGKFTERSTWSFTSGTTLPSTLYASSYTVQDTQFDSNAPYNHRFQTSNVKVTGGYLNLLVPGGQNPAADSEKAITSAEITTSRSDILYASVRTKAIFGDAAGTCAGNFFYYSDQQEIDIEFLSDPTSQSNTGTKPNPIWYTNQPVTANSPVTESSLPGLANQTTALNEYRIDWVKGQTKFYVNGRLQTSYTQNVPTTAGSWVWNNWSNGDKGWSVGPPAKDNAFKIQVIDMFYNTTSSASKKC